MATQKMSIRKMFEMLVRKCADQRIYSVKLIDISDGAVYESKHPIDLIFTAAESGWNHLWVLEVLSLKVINNQILGIVNTDISQNNGDPDFPTCAAK